MEFGIIAIPMFLMMFGIFDLGRYALTLHSLGSLVDESARAEIICYSPRLATNAAVNCSGDPLSAATKQSLVPFLYVGGLSPTVTTTAAGPHIITASQPNFTMIIGFLPASMNAPSASIPLPF